MIGLVKILAIFLLVSIFAVGCDNTMSNDYYERSNVGQLRPVERGAIVSARQVRVSSDNAVGTAGGALAGGVLGSAIAGRDSQGLGILGGAALGGLIGNRIQNSNTEKFGMEYVVRTARGLISVVQGINPPFYPGDRVLVQYSGPNQRAQLIADTGYFPDRPARGYSPNRINYRTPHRRTYNRVAPIGYNIPAETHNYNYYQVVPRPTTYGAIPAPAYDNDDDF